MAGEIQDSFNFSFQGDSVHSGSISFGRFENESLSWERRSSFSRNRYLEEVKTCSKPGSVNEKKAYFEAHFRKKKLLHLLQQSSSCEQQTGTEQVQSNEYDASENMYSSDESHLVYTANYVCAFDESTMYSEYGGGCLHGKADIPLSESANNDGLISKTDVIEDNVLQEDYFTEEPHHHTEDECTDIPIIFTKGEMLEKHSSDDEGEKMNLSSQVIYPSSKYTPPDEARRCSEEHHSSPKDPVVVELKPSKVKIKSQPLAAHAWTTVSGEPSKVSDKKMMRRIRASPLGTSKEKHAPVTSSTPALFRGTPTSWDRDIQRTKAAKETKCARESKGKKFAVASPSSAIINKNESRGDSTEIRLPRSRDLTNPRIFNFKSNERAERRKEYYLKLEEQMNAKEAEINQIQARAQEKTDAEIKQLRRSLNFKATPMPYFYHADRRKSSNKVRQTQVSQKPHNPQKEATGTARSRHYSRTGNMLSISAASDLSVTSSSTLGSVQKQETSETIKTVKTLRSERKTNTGTARTRSSTMPKKAIGISVGMRTDHTAVVGVAS